MILFWILWFIVGAVISFAFLVHAHKQGYIDDVDKMWAFCMLIAPPIGIGYLIVAIGVWMMDKVTKFIEQRF